MHFLMNGKSFTLLRFLVFISLLTNIGCQKDISAELPAGSGGGGGGTNGGSAQFALVPSGSNCSDAVVTGSFVAGVDLGPDAMLTVTVNVTKTGDWSYSTRLVNGYVFTGAGSFTTTGNQTIKLIAAGKPEKTGNNAFSLNIGSVSCSFIVTVAATGGGGGTTLGEFYYKATIDGVNYVQDVTFTNGYEPGVGMSGSTDVVFGGGIVYSNPPLPAGKTEFGIDKGVMHGYGSSTTPAQFKAFFPVGNVSYGPASFSSGDGVKVYWSDPVGGNWETRNGPVDQTGSTFKILSVQDFVDLAGDQYVKVKVEFNCKLYNTATGAMKTLTNGEAVVAFGMF
jgi:hypothetical protein